jgi:hypothetical protein
MHLRAEGRLELPKPTLGYGHFGLAAMGKRNVQPTAGITASYLRHRLLCVDSGRSRRAEIGQKRSFDKRMAL